LQDVLEKKHLQFQFYREDDQDRVEEAVDQKDHREYLMKERKVNFPRPVEKDSFRFLLMKED